MTEEMIEVGADAGDLRYWQAKEAMRHAELRLGSQSATLQAFEARATSILGWLVAILTTLAGAAAFTLQRGDVAGAVGLSTGFIPACIAVLADARRRVAKAVVGAWL